MYTCGHVEEEAQEEDRSRPCGELPRAGHDPQEARRVRRAQAENGSWRSLVALFGRPQPGRDRPGGSACLGEESAAASSPAPIAARPKCSSRSTGPGPLGPAALGADRSTWTRPVGRSSRRAWATTPEGSRRTAVGGDHSRNALFPLSCPWETCRPALARRAGSSSQGHGAEVPE